MRNCDCVGHRVYARRVFNNGSVHFCVQCLRCLQVCKLPEHGNRPWIKATEIPAGRGIYDFIEPKDAK